MQIAHMGPTGGTTGLPKIVARSHNSLLTGIESNAPSVNFAATQARKPRLVFLKKGAQDDAAWAFAKGLKVKWKEYRTLAEPAGRVIVGTSFGGLFAAHVAFHHSETFGGALIQSPAFEYDFHVHGDRLRKAYRSGDRRPTRIFIDVGTLYDELAYTRDFRDILRQKGWQSRYAEVNEGHSWGHWRAWVDDALTYLLAADE